jgi:hypothetical protein
MGKPILGQSTCLTLERDDEAIFMLVVLFLFRLGFWTRFEGKVKHNSILSSISLFKKLSVHTMGKKSFIAGFLLVAANF